MSIGVILLMLFFVGILFAFMYGFFNVIRKLIDRIGCGNRNRPGFLFIILCLVAAAIGVLLAPRLFASLHYHLFILADTNSFFSLLAEIPSSLLDLMFQNIGLTGVFAGISVLALIVQPGSWRTWKNGTVGFLLPLICMFFPLWYTLMGFLIAAFIMVLLISFILACLSIGSGPGAVLIFIFGD